MDVKAVLGPVVILLALAVFTWFAMWADERDFQERLERLVQ